MVLLVTLLLAPGLALAVEYPVPVVVSSEDDVHQLYENGQLTEDERDRLLDLFRARVDLNTADRDRLYELPGMSFPLADQVLAHRRANGDFARPEDLKLVPGFPDEVWVQVQGFVDAGTPFGWLKSLRGRVRLRGNGLDTRYKGDDPAQPANPADPDPAFAQQADLVVLDDYKAGWTLLLDDHLGAPSFYPAQGDTPGYFVSDGDAYGPRLAKFYASGRWGRWEAIGGHFRAGFGQGLAFDTTTRLVPFGAEADNQIYEVYENVGFRRPLGQRGLAVNGRGLALGSLRADVSAFASYTTDDLYQYDFTPHDIYLAGPGQGTSSGEKLSFQTVPSVSHEVLAGGAVRLHLDERSHLGFTGYGATVRWAYGDGFAFAPSASYPEDRTTYGAFGADFEAGTGPWTFFGEAAATEGLDLALYARALLEMRGLEVDLSARSFGTDFDNPHARGRASADEYLGNRDRDERGGRLSVTGKPWRGVRLSGAADVWQRPSNGLWADELYLRADWQAQRWLSLAAFTFVRDRDLSRGGRGEDYDGGTDEDPAHGMKLDWALQAAVHPGAFTLMAFYRRTLKDAGLGDSFEPSHYAWVRAAWRVNDAWQLAVRGKYYDVNTTSSSGDHYWEGYGEARARLARWLNGTLRYTYADWPDKQQVVHHVKGVLEVLF
jgi:hypothetical protein